MGLMHRLTSQKRKLYIGAGVVLLALSAGLLGGLSPKASAQDCDNNAIIHCGFQNASQFIQYVQNGRDDLGHTDLHNLYAHYNLAPADYTKFVSSARLGTAYKNGDVVVDGQTVAHNGFSIGRLASYQGSNPQTVAIYGVGTYYGNSNQQAFQASSIPVMVLFNSRGVMQFAVLTSCGNPLTGSPVTPNYGCDVIHKAPVSGQKDTYNFTATAHASNNANVVRYTYNFGDGSPQVVTTAGGAVATHHYAKPGTYKATVTITVTLPGNQSVTATSAPCATTVTVSPPPAAPKPYYSCVQLTPAFVDKNTYNYSFKVTASYGNGAKFTSAHFDFGDNSGVVAVTPNGSTASTTHKYKNAGTYSINTVLYFTVNNATVKAVPCTAKVTPTEVVSECLPGVAQGSPLCNCKYNSSLPANSPDCTPPVTTTTLPNTGAGDVIAIFGAVVVAGFIIFRQFIYKRNRAVTNDAAAMSLGHHMVAGAQKDDQSTEMIQHLTHAEPTVHPQSPAHRNAAGTAHQASYHHGNRFRPGSDKK